MKRFFVLILAAMYALCACAALSETITADSLLSDSCILVDAATGEVLFSKNADLKRSPASTTKIMTLLIAIQQSNPNEIVTIPECVQNIAPDSSVVPVYYGEKMPMRDLWYGLMYRSGNDAANAIAELTSGSVDAFVEEMNKTAESLGMTNTQFKNPHGYTQDGHYTTARDLALLAMHALNDDCFREISFGDTYTMAATALRDELVISHSYSITDYNSPYYYQYARGIKTGYTAKAGQCYVGAAVKDGRELIVVLLRCGWTKPEKWVEAKKLFQYGFETLEAREIHE